MGHFKDILPSQLFSVVLTELNLTKTDNKTDASIGHQKVL